MKTISGPSEKVKFKIGVARHTAGVQTTLAKKSNIK
jgi:hypothetical protein